MDADEREIFYYLKSYRNEFISAREISRRAGGKKKFRSEPEWAKPVLTRMVERGILEADTSGHYRIKPMSKKTGKRKWVSPQIQRILRESGKEFADIQTTDDEMDAYYDNL
ncbi:MAG: hypothetical protein EXS33_07780 [Pedosphaera sp.]|nr:hypothetical protein [Pedosphaera sp.]